MSGITERVSVALAERAAGLQAALSSPVRSPRMAVVLGRVLAGAFLVCFATGLYSHFLQEPLPWMRFSPRPRELYAWTQGTHIAVGVALFPLLLGKLWTVYPRLFRWPPITSLRHLLERVSIAVLVASALLEPVIGLLNTYQWYPWPFSFRRTHYGLAWVIIGSLAVHIAVKLPVIVEHWRRSKIQTTGSDSTLSRRAFLAGIGVSSATIVGLTAGQSFGWLAPLNLFAPRVRGSGPQSLPVNRTARQADVISSATDPDWVLTVTNGANTRSFSRAALQALPQVEAELPIACVEGWSTSARWRGVRLADLMATVDAPVGSELRISSLQPRGPYRRTMMGAEFVQDPTTLVALELNGEPLDLDHGFPARIIAPGRPGVLQTKWLSLIEVT